MFFLFPKLVFKLFVFVCVYCHSYKIIFTHFFHGVFIKKIKKSLLQSSKNRSITSSIFADNQGSHVCVIMPKIEKTNAGLNLCPRLKVTGVLNSQA